MLCVCVILYELYYQYSVLVVVIVMHLMMTDDVDIYT